METEKEIDGNVHLSRDREINERILNDLRLKARGFEIPTRDPKLKNKRKEGKFLFSRIKNRGSYFLKFVRETSAETDAEADKYAKTDSCRNYENNLILFYE